MKIQQPAIHVTEIIMFMTIIMTIVQCDIVHAWGTLCICLFVCKPLHEGKDLVALEWCLVIGWKCQRDSGGLEYGTTYLIAKVTIFLIFVWFSSQVCHHRESCLEFDASVFSQKCCWVPSFGNHLHKKQQIFGVGLISTFLHTLC